MSGGEDGFLTKEESNMSWSVSGTGDRETVRKVIGEGFDASARNYTSQKMLEGADVHAFRGAVMSAIETIALGENDVLEVNCYGSRGDNDYMSATLSVQRRAKNAK